MREGLHELAPWAAWHGRLMVVAWGVMIPLGILAARFFKVLPHQNWPHTLDTKWWWHAHRGLQYSGVVIMLCGIAFAWGNAKHAAPADTLHAVLAWGLVALAALQIMGGIARGSKGGPTSLSLRGDHYDMTRRRLIFERLHKSVGYLAACLSVVVVILGLVAADAPRWMYLLLSLWWLTLVFLFVKLQRQNRSFDTYQAIWGPDLSHPGNQLPSSGWGTKRHTAPTFAKAYGQIHKKD